jgi:hypothetical protein
MGYDGETSANVYTAGLLHDIGKLALGLNFEEDYDRLLKDAEKKGLFLHQVEEEFFGAAHAETGAYLLALWGMPLPIVEAVAGHHWPADRLSSDCPAVTALRLADQLANAPGNLHNILAEYPSELGLWPRVEQFEVLLGIPKDQRATRRKAGASARPAKNNLQGMPSPAPAAPPGVRRGPETLNGVQGRRLAFYTGAGALVLMAVLLLVSFWPRTGLLSEAAVPLRAHSKERAESSNALAKEDDATKLHEPVSLEGTPEPLLAFEPFEPPFPFDQLLPMTEAALGEEACELDPRETKAVPETGSTAHLATDALNFSIGF